MGGLQDLAPVTLYTDAGAAGGLVSAWSQMPASLGGNAGGLTPPLQCKEVGACKPGAIGGGLLYRVGFLGC